MYPDPEAGSNAAPDQQTINQININTEFFESKQVRLKFVKKVYSLLSIQLLITVAIVAVFALQPDVKDWGKKNGWFYPAAFGAAFSILILISCFKSLSRKHPINLVILFAFTLAESLMLSAITIHFETRTIMLAASITLGLTLALTLFAMQTRYDFTAKLGILLVVLLTLIIVMFIAMLFPKTFEPLMLLLAGAMAILMGIFIVVDTQMIMGGTHSLQVSPEEYIFATINLYLDIINLFVYILIIMGRK